MNGLEKKGCNNGKIGERAEPFLRIARPILVTAYAGS